MFVFKRLGVLAGCGLCLVLASCGSSGSPSLPVSAKLVHRPGSSTGKIVLSSIGAQRIGLQTTPVRTSGGHNLVIPYSAVVYDPSGKTYAFTQTARLTYVEVPVNVDRINGSSAYLRTGPQPGSRVVSVGAEELFGVQAGVLAQT